LPWAPRGLGARQWWDMPSATPSWLVSLWGGPWSQGVLDQVLKDVLEGPVSSLREVVLCQQQLILDQTTLTRSPANAFASPNRACTHKVTKRGVEAGCVDLESSIKSNGEEIRPSLLACKWFANLSGFHYWQQTRSSGKQFWSKLSG